MNATPPKGLKVRGRKLWRELHVKYEFDMQEADLVLETCRTLDVIDSLAAEVATAGVMVAGSQGQLVLNPAIAELRQTQASFARLVTSLNLDSAEVGGGILTATTVRAKIAANARWSKSKEVRRA